MNLYERIPNNVNLSEDKRLQRALEKWLPNFLSWWNDMGPEGFQEKDVWLRTAIDVGSDSWAHFDYVKMPEYRWGIFLEPAQPDAKVGFGDNYGAPAYQEVPGEFRNALRRIIVTQGDTEPASVEQQRRLGATCPSLYDLRNLFQVNVEEGRHLWAMVYLLHTYFGRDGREEARALLERRSGNPDKPRILGAFNQPIDDLALLLHVHHLHRPRRQVPAARARRVGLRPAVAHLPLHADRGGAPHVRRRERHEPHRRAHRRVPARRQGAALRGRARPGDDPEVPELLVLALARPLRQRGLDQRRTVLRRGSRPRCRRGRARASTRSS